MARDIYNEMQNAKTPEEYNALAAERYEKELGMKASGTWNDAWKSTSDMGGGYVLGSNAPMKNSYSNPYAQLQQQSSAQLQNMKSNQKQNVNTQFDTAAQQAYIQKMQAEKNAPAIMAMTGQTGGLAETSALAPQLAYGNALTQLNQSKSQALSQIDMSADQQALQMAIEFADKAISQANNDRNFDYGMSRDRISDSRYADETAYSRGATAQQTAYQRALDASKYGDFTGLRNLGIDTSGSEKDYNNRNNPYYGKAVSSGGSGGSYKPKLTAAQTMSALNSGNRAQSVLDAYEYYYDEPYQEKNGANQESQSNPQISGIAKLANNLWNNTGGDRYQLLRFLSTYQGREGITDDGLIEIAGQFGVTLE